MNPLLRALYAGAGRVARAAVWTGLPGNGKLSRTLLGRRDLIERYRAFARDGRDLSRPLVWFHAPSVGEGLQATPVMQRLRAQRPDVQLAYTYFSPSAEGFAQRSGADFHDYLPFDDRAEMSAALDALQPSVLIFSKLDVWPMLVEQAAQRGVRLGMISATLAEGSGRRGGLAAALTRDAYAALEAVGAIDAADAGRLIDIGVRHSVIRVTGDTRYDQVWARAAAAATSAPWLERFRAERRMTLVAGSTWPSDDAVLLPAWAQLAARFPGQLRLIIAPHEPTTAHLAPIETWAAQRGLRCERLDAPADTTADVMLVDRVGVLGDLYALADTAVVGGGFHSAGLHSVLEPAAFGVPVLFGPQFRNSRDAELLLRDGGGYTVADTRSLVARLTTLLEPATPGARRTAGLAAQQRVEAGRGAADRATALVLSLLG